MQLVLVGGRDNATSKVSTVRDSQSRGWVHPYPPMATAQDFAQCHAVGYDDYLIVAGGSNSGTKAYPM